MADFTNAYIDSQLCELEESEEVSGIVMKDIPVPLLPRVS